MHYISNLHKRMQKPPFNYVKHSFKQGTVIQGCTAPSGHQADMLQPPLKRIFFTSTGKVHVATTHTLSSTLTTKVANESASDFYTQEMHLHARKGMKCVSY